MKETSYSKPIHQAIAVLFIILALLTAMAAIYSVRFIVLATLIGLGIGTLLSPISEALKKRYKIPRALTSLLLLIAGFGTFFLVGYLIIDIISEQIIPVIHNIPAIVQRLEGKFNHFSGQNFDPAKYFGGAANAVFNGVKVGATAIGGMSLIFFLALYFSIQSGDYFTSLISAFPAHLRPKTRKVLEHSALSLRGWFKAQLLAMAIVGALAALVLKIVGSPYWIFFGVIAMVLELIPYFGPITAFATICIVTLAADPGALLKTAIAFSLVLMAEGNLIIPLVMKGRIELRPVQLLILMAIMGEWFGVFGFLMAAPTLAVLRTIYIEAYVPLMDSQTIPPQELGTTQILGKSA
jgi:predicted PurR-regulated permease PerM